MKLKPATVDRLGMVAMGIVVAAALLFVVIPLLSPPGTDPVRMVTPDQSAVPTDSTSSPAEVDDAEDPAGADGPDGRVRKIRAPREDPTQQPSKEPGTEEGAGGQQVVSSPPALPVAPAQPVPVFADFVVSSFNVLGSSHTAGAGGRKGFEPGTTRARYAAQLLDQHQVQVVGFQELQPDQMRVLQDATDGRYSIYPGMSLGREAGVNSVAWLRSDWTATDAQTVTMPYFNGNARELPLVRLQHNNTGLEMWVANFHNPADAHGPAQRWRDEATRRQIALVNDLVAETGLPVVYTGDFNDRAEYFCPLVGQTTMVASNGGSVDGGCYPPSPMHVDWVFATPEVSWLGHLADRGPLVQRTTDHPVIVARAKLNGLLTPDGRVDPQTVQETRRAMERVED